MPRGKKKATASEAPPSTPPNAKKRKVSASSAKGEIAVTSNKRGASRASTRASSKTAVTLDPLGLRD